MLPLNFLAVNTRTKATSIQIFRIQQWWRVKVKNKRMKDRLKAMHQGMSLILFTFFRFCFDCLRCQAWLITCVRYATWFWRRALVSWMTLLLFNSHTLIFFSPLTISYTQYWGFRPVLWIFAHKMHVLDHWESLSSCIILQKNLSQMS